MPACWQPSLPRLLSIFSSAAVLTILFLSPSSGQIQALDTFDGNGGFDRIFVTSSFGISVDLSAAAADGLKGFLDIEEIDFDTGGGSSTQTTITLNANQFGAGKIATDAIIDGSIGIDNLVINMTEPGSFDMAPPVLQLELRRRYGHDQRLVGCRFDHL